LQVNGATTLLHLKLQDILYNLWEIDSFRWIGLL
jgi:hypothetical protein